jgi:hypothetical protein
VPERSLPAIVEEVDSEDEFEVAGSSVCFFIGYVGSGSDFQDAGNANESILSAIKKEVEVEDGSKSDLLIADEDSNGSPFRHRF